MGEATAMNFSPDRLRQYVAELSGHCCVDVLNSVGSHLLIDFGRSGEAQEGNGESAGEPWRTLLIASPWRIQTPEQVLCDWNADNSVGGALQTCAHQLVGRRLESIQLMPPGWDLVLAFEGGLSLLVFSDSDINRRYSWTLCGPEGSGLQVGASAILWDEGE